MAKIDLSIEYSIRHRKGKSSQVPWVTDIAVYVMGSHVAYATLTGRYTLEQVERAWAREPKRFTFTPDGKAKVEEASQLAALVSGKKAAA